MSSSFSIDFVQALNPLYAFPIVAVILCAFIVYAFGFKAPVPPPSFEGIEDEKKVSRKRKTKETNKQGKLIQNGKVNGSTVNKPQISPPGKKKEIEKSTFNDKTATEKQSSIEKKTNKKVKSQNEKKNVSEKRKETVSEDNGGDGWVQLISKKGRKSRKKDEASFTENQPAVTKPIKNSEAAKFDESSPSQEAPKKNNEVAVENSLPETKPVLKEFEEEKGSAEIAPSIENSKEKLISDIKSDKILEKIPSKEGDVKPEKLIEESSNKSKKKKKKNVEVINTDNKAIINIPETPAVPVTSEMSSPAATIDSTVTVETSQVVIGKDEADMPKESKSSNVVFDELAGLYPEAKEQRRKRKVRRDH